MLIHIVVNWKGLSTPRQIWMIMFKTRRDIESIKSMKKNVKKCDLATPYYRKLIKVFFKHFLLFAISISLRVVLKSSLFLRDADFMRPVLEWWKKYKKREKKRFLQFFSSSNVPFWRGFTEFYFFDFLFSCRFLFAIMFF